MTDLLARLEGYYDEVPRANADTEEHGPFTIFVSRGGWPYYARPRLGLVDEVTPGDVTSVPRPAGRARRTAVDRVGRRDDAEPAARRGSGGDRGRGLPAAGPRRRPRRAAEPRRRTPRGPGDPDLGAVRAAIHVGFDQDDTRTGPASVAERDAKASELG